MRWLPLLLIFPGALALAYFWWDRDPSPQGEGSFKEAEQVRSAFREDTVKQLRKSNSRWGGYPSSLGDGSRIEIVGTGSHARPRGGTVGIKFEDDSVHVFFTHVCRGPEGYNFSGSSKDDLLEHMRQIGTEYQPTPKP